MARFENTEIAFEVPDDWVDLSLTAFVYPEAETSIALSKRTAERGVPLAAYTTALIASLGAACPELELLDRRAVEAGSAPAERVDVAWEHPDQPRRDVVVLALRGAELWSLAASSPVDRLEETEAAVAGALATFEVLP